MAKILKIFLILLLLVIIVLVIFYFLNLPKNEKVKIPFNISPSNNTLWSFDGQSYNPSNTPPECPDPLVLDSPVNVNLASGILYPGQIRGDDYKAHGGIRFDGLKDNKVEVRAIMDGYILKAAKYEDEDSIQYFFFYVNSCGIMIMHDHLLTLSPKLQKVFDKIPLGKNQDSRTTEITPLVYLSEGELLGTEVGYPKYPGGVNGKNIFLDFGLYDLRKTNEVSYSDKFTAQNPSVKEYGKYAVCFLEYLYASEKELLQSLPASGREGKISDYCTP